MKKVLAKAVLILAGAVAAAPATAANVSQPSNHTQSVPVKDAIDRKTNVPKSMQKHLEDGKKKSFHLAGKVYKNQRQYRKMLRSNPHFRNSKKCKL